MENTSINHIDRLDVSQPTSGAPLAKSDDHLRFIKAAIKGTFTGLTYSSAAGAVNTVTASAARLNDIPIPDGTAMLFVQPAAPTGWSRINVQHNKALRIVNGNDYTPGSGLAGGDSGPQGGTGLDFTTAFASRGIGGNIGNKTVGGTVNSTTLTINQIPSHSHKVANSGTSTSSSAVNHALAEGGIYGDHRNSYDLSGVNASANRYNSSNTGGGGGHSHGFTGASHNHSFSGTDLDLTVKYVNAIICTKDAP